MSTRRPDAKDARWAAEQLDRTVAPLRVRARHLRAGDDEHTHNTWDDVAMTDEEEAAAEAIVRAQPLASAATADVCRREAARRWDKHYDDNPRSACGIQRGFSSLQPPSLTASRGVSRRRRLPRPALPAQRVPNDTHARSRANRRRWCAVGGSRDGLRRGQRLAAIAHSE
jgi:hypothetical protein